MEHIDWLHPDHIILSNSKTSLSHQEFTKHMRSKEFQDLRLLKVKDNHFIRYKFDGCVFWYRTMILQIKNKDYYIDISLLLYGEDKQLETNYIRFNREEVINNILYNK